VGPVPVALDFGFPVTKGPGDRDRTFNFWMGFFR
jgi:outer membrane protein insertion porin family